MTPQQIVLEGVEAAANMHSTVAKLEAAIAARDTVKVLALADLTRDLATAIYEEHLIYLTAANLKKEKENENGNDD